MAVSRKILSLIVGLLCLLAVTAEKKEAAAAAVTAERKQKCYR